MLSDNGVEWNTPDRQVETTSRYAVELKYCLFRFNSNPICEEDYHVS